MMVKDVTGAILVAIAVTTLAMAACRTGVLDVDVDLEEPWIDGVITRVDANEEVLQVLIEENPKIDEPLEEGGGKINFSVTDETVLLQSTDGEMRPTAGSSIEQGRRAAAVTYGIVMESYPAQAFADTLIIYR